MYLRTNTWILPNKDLARPNKLSEGYKHLVSH